MKKAYTKEIFRSIGGGKRRFFSILLITALGVTMLTGLRATCVDLRFTADRFFDSQHLFDVVVQSTLGLTAEDVAALSKVEGVQRAEGAWTQTVKTAIGDKKQSADVKSLSTQGINAPYVVTGRLPETDREIAVTGDYLKDSGKKIGDTLTLQKGTETASASASSNEATDIFPLTAYTITGTVIDATDVNGTGGVVNFRTSSSSDYAFFVTGGAAVSKVYTAVYLVLDGTADKACFSQSYTDQVNSVVKTIESQIKSQREQARTDGIIKEASDKVSAAEAEMNDQFDRADAKIAAARQELADGQKQLDAGSQELAAQQRSMEEQIAEAQQTINAGYAGLVSGQATLDQSRAQLELGQTQLEQAKTTLAQKRQETEDTLSAALDTLAEQSAQVSASKTELEGKITETAAAYGPAWPQTAWDAYVASAGEAWAPVVAIQMEEQQLKTRMAALSPNSPEYAALESQLSALTEQENQAKAQIDSLTQAAREAFFAALPAPPSDEMAQALVQLALGAGQLDATQTALDTQTQTVKDQQAQAETQFAAAEQTLAESAQKLADGWSQWTAGQLQIQSGLSQLAAGQSELSQKQASGQAQIDQAKATLAASQRTLDEGRTTLATNEAELDTQKADARAKIADAWKDVGKIDAAKWYVQDRSSLGSYANIQSDANSIEAVGTAFPVLFLIVAVLISLTTITRMVEEERGLIGTYKALGFTDREIRRKYLVYAFLASFLGGVLGNICGFLILPQILFSVFRTLYSLPAYALRFDPVYGLSGVALFVVAITGATAIACRVELNQTPADLMRPKSPRAGSRVFLEYLPGLWSRMSFLNKVTARNLFRYKKRLLMTILGIMGCAALMMCGFAIRDSVKELMPEQYVQTFKYDVMAVSSGDDNETLLSRFRGNPEVSDYINLQITNVKVKSVSGKEQTVQLYVIPDGTSLEGYIGLRDAGGQGVTLPDNGVLVTQNASQVMGFGAGDTLSVQDLELKQADVRVAGVVRNYLGNMIYMSQKTYSAAFGKMAPNAVLAHLSTPAGSHRAFVNSLEQHDEILSASSTQANKEDMFKAFSLVNMIVTIIIVLAAGLAFVVLFTLSTTNISERGRELATIKVLGFYNPEVHLYVNKETMILTVIGIALGLPLGRYIGGLITEVLNMPSIYLAITVYPASYAVTAALTLVFALAVAVITNRVLDSIDPVEALKSVE